MDGFKPLILCLPERVRGKTLKEGTSQSQLVRASQIWTRWQLKIYEQTLKRPLFAEEWKIFNYYACRVRSLTIYHWNIDEIDSQVTGVFVSAPSPILLPNLRSLYWWDGRGDNLSLLRALLASTIRSMTLGIKPGVPWRPSFKKSTLLVSLGARCPHIQEFVCPYDSNPGKHLDAIWEVACCWSKLIHLRAGVLNTRALAHLASLPSLKFLHFISYDFVDRRRPKSIPTFTSEIDEVSITASSLPILTRCLRNVHFISCRSVKLHVSKSGLPRDPLDMSDLVLSLSECFSPALEQLAVEFAELKFPLSTQKSVDPCFVLSSHAIVPLLPFSHLTVVDLGWFCASDIDDVMVKKMAQSWPQLEEFYLGNGACWLIPPSLTFIGLVHLI